MGLQLPDWPEIIIRYSHVFRQGQKDSTIWGDTNLTGLTTDQTTRKIAPVYRDIDEARDIVSLEISKTFDNTDIGLGMRYEHDIATTPSTSSVIPTKLASVSSLKKKATISICLVGMRRPRRGSVIHSG